MGPTMSRIVRNFLRLFCSKFKKNEEFSALNGEKKIFEELVG